MNILKTVIIFIIFYLGGLLLRDKIYSLTLNTITFFSNNKIHFFGKLWNLLGVPKFGIIFLLIPLYNFLGSKYFTISDRSNALKFWGIFILYILTAFLLVCYIYYRYLITLIETNKIMFQNGSTPLHNVNLYVIASCTIGIAILTHWLTYRLLIRPRINR